MIDSAFGQFMSDTFGAFDLSVFSAFATVQNPLFNQIAVIVSAICSEYFLIMLGLLSCVLCLFKKWRKWGIAILLSVMAAVIIGKLIVNPLAGRLRPYNVLQGTGDFFTWYTSAGMIPESKYSFPSCHTFAAFSIACCIFVLLKNKKSWKAITVWIVAVLIACSRVYLMVHYPTDVLCGVVLGLIFGFLSAHFAIMYDKHVHKWPIFKVIDRIDLAKLFKGKNKQTEFTHDEYEEIVANSKHAKVADVHIQNKKSRLDCKLIFCAVILITVVAIGIQEYGVHGGFHRCEHRGNDYICMNKGKNEIEQNGTIHYYCDLHEDDTPKD